MKGAIEKIVKSNNDFSDMEIIAKQLVSTCLRIKSALWNCCNLIDFMHKDNIDATIFAL